jgi:seryl-tRNA synthetase
MPNKSTKAKGNADELLKEKEELTKQKSEKEAIAAEKQKELNATAKKVGNYVHSSVTVSNTEDDNAVIKTWAPEGTKVEKQDCLSHHEVLYRIGGYDPERGVKIVGHRGYCLTDYGFFLNREVPLRQSNF